MQTGELLLQVDSGLRLLYSSISHNFFFLKRFSFASPIRDFDVEVVTDPRQSPSQLEGKSQKAEPVWSTQLSPDSACSEGSAGSLEPPQDAGQTDEGSYESVVMVMVLELCSPSLLSPRVQIQTL